MRSTQFMGSSTHCLGGYTRGVVVFQDMRKVKYRGGPSQLLDPVDIDGFQVKSLRHGNTGHVLYYAPRVSDLEMQWTMDFETAKKGVQKLKESAGNSTKGK